MYATPSHHEKDGKLPYSRPFRWLKRRWVNCSAIISSVAWVPFSTYRARRLRFLSYADPCPHVTAKGAPTIGILESKTFDNEEENSPDYPTNCIPVDLHARPPGFEPRLQYPKYCELPVTPWAKVLLFFGPFHFFNVYVRGAVGL
jgi:hypothetical protein